MPKSHLIALSLLAFLPAVGGCQTAQDIAKPITRPLTGGNAFQVTESELKDRLATFGVALVLTTENATLRVLAERHDLEMRRFCLVWRNRIFVHTRVMQQHTDPRVALLDYWVVCYQIKEFFVDGPGKALLGEQSHYAVAAYDQAIRNYTELARGVLPEKHFESAQKRVLDFVENNEITGAAMRSPNLPSNSKGGFGTTLSLSLGVSKSVEATANEVHRLTDMIEVIPYQLRLNVESILLDDSSVQIQEDITRISESVQAMQRTADELPHDIGEEVRKTLESAREPLKTTLDQTNEALVTVKETMKEARGIVTEAKEAIGEVNKTVDKATLALDTFKEAGQAWKATFEELNKLAGTADSGADASAEGGSSEDKESGGGGSDDGSDSGSDDIENITVALEELSASAKELRGLVGDVNELIGSSELTERIDDVDSRAQDAIDHTTMRMTGLIGVAARWGIALVLVFFGALFAYKLALRRWARKPTAA